MTEILIEFLKLYGLKEITGKDNNPEIIKMFSEIGFNWVKDDETAWCSACLNFICKKLGYERSGKLDAKSWLKMPIQVLKPSLGDIVILQRGDKTSWQGHVGLYIAEDDKYVYILGGNQGNMVDVQPFLKERVLGYRQVHKIADN